MFDILVIGAGPAGVVAAMRAADLGAGTALVTRDEFGGMAANDGPVPVRTLAHAARLDPRSPPARPVRYYGRRTGARLHPPVGEGSGSRRLRPVRIRRSARRSTR